MNVPMVLMGVLCYLTKRQEGRILGGLCRDRGSVPDPSSSQGELDVLQVCHCGVNHV